MKHENRISVEHQFLLAVVLLLLLEVFLFRNVLFNDKLLSEIGDGRLTMLITEHWFHVFCGDASLTELGIFYPTKNTIAYSDMMLGFGFLHSVFRALGVNVFLSFKYTIIIFHVVGTLSVLYLLNKVLSVDTFWSLCGTIAFSFSNAFSIVFWHTQMLCIMLLPIVIINAVRLIQCITDRKKRNIHALTIIVCLAIILYTAWYIAFFSALFFLTLAIIIIIQLIIEGKLKGIWEACCRNNNLLIDFVAWVIIGIILIIPFALIELSVLNSSGAWGYDSICQTLLPEPIDIIKTPDNLLFGWLPGILNLSQRLFDSNIYEGYSIAVILMFIYTLSFSFRVKKDSNNRNMIMVAQSAAIAVIIGLIMVVRVGENATSLWWLIYNYFPGGKAIRAAGRYVFYLSLPLTLSMAVLGNAVSSSRSNNNPSKRRKIAFRSMILMLLIVSGIHVGGVYSTWSISEANRVVDGIKEAPEDCSCFFITRVSPDSSYIYGDAFQISDFVGVPTINGFSGAVPPGYGNIWDPGSESYFTDIKKWISEKNLDNVYGYDCVSKEWKKYSAEDNLDRN